MSVRQQNGESPQTAELLQKVRNTLRGFGIPLPPDFNDETRLISSGILDSLALYNLLIWIEEQTGRSVDPAKMDIRCEWDTVRDIVAFLQPAVPFQSRQSRRSHSGYTNAIAANQRGIEFLRCRATHRDAVAEFQTGLWSRSRELNARYFDWKYREAPHSEDTKVYLAMQDGQIVGMRSFYGSLWEHGPSRALTRALVADDLLVRADHFNTGLVSDLMNYAFVDIAESGDQYLFSLTGGPITVMNSLAMGWNRVGIMGPIGRVRNYARWRRTLQETAARSPLIWRIVQNGSLWPRPYRSRTPWLPAAVEHNPS